MPLINWQRKSPKQAARKYLVGVAAAQIIDRETVSPVARNNRLATVRRSLIGISNKRLRGLVWSLGASNRCPQPKAS